MEEGLGAAWSEPDATTFMVRGSDYMKTRRKINSGKAIYRLLHTLCMLRAAWHSYTQIWSKVNALIALYGNRHAGMLTASRQQCLLFVRPYCFHACYQQSISVSGMSNHLHACMHDCMRREIRAAHVGHGTEDDQHINMCIRRNMFRYAACGHNYHTMQEQHMLSDMLLSCRHQLPQLQAPVIVLLPVKLTLKLETSF